jgi:hypothetical protein
MECEYEVHLLYLFALVKMFHRGQYLSSEYIISSRLKCGLLETEHQKEIFVEHGASAYDVS